MNAQVHYFHPNSTSVRALIAQLQAARSLSKSCDAKFRSAPGNYTPEHYRLSDLGAAADQRAEGFAKELRIAIDNALEPLGLTLREVEALEL